MIAHENVLGRMSAGTGRQARGSLRSVADRYLSRPILQAQRILQRRRRAALSRSRRAYRWRQHGVLPLLGCDRRGRHSAHRQLSGDRLAKGGTIQGVLDGLNQILDIAIPEFRSQGGTLVIPGHGRLCDTGDVANYRNMVAIMRDRMADSDQKRNDVGAGEGGEADDGIRRPVRRDHGPWTTDMFVEAAYKSLSKSTRYNNVEGGVQ